MTVAFVPTHNVVSQAATIKGCRGEEGVATGKSGDVYHAYCVFGMKSGSNIPASDPRLRCRRIVLLDDRGSVLKGASSGTCALDGCTQTRPGMGDATKGTGCGWLNEPLAHVYQLKNISRDELGHTQT